MTSKPTPVLEDATGVVAYLLAEALLLLALCPTAKPSATPSQHAALSKEEDQVQTGNALTMEDVTRTSLSTKSHYIGLLALPVVIRQTHSH